MRDFLPAVYILASRKNGTLYTGVTSNLIQRVWQHSHDLVDGFTREYGVHTLVYYEIHATMEAAIQREKRLKKWNRAWKLRLIEEINPDWADLWGALVGEHGTGASPRGLLGGAQDGSPGSPPSRG